MQNKSNTELKLQFILKAQELYHDEGTVEVDTDVDPNEAVSMSEPMDGGAYVRAWVWVSIDDLD